MPEAGSQFTVAENSTTSTIATQYCGSETPTMASALADRSIHVLRW